MNVKVHTIIIKDAETGKAYSVKTLRSAEEITGYIEETENEEITDRFERPDKQVYDRFK